ncbi:hypothetical protein BSK54_12510 [Paenibacillus odorifer]|uniref:hypothetical protein n=1 Tax=Paenibacillus odorifer TaxID=189426 RepID=UPI00096D1192|nr:hypothetical protein [Paenibacillus odorifer]OME02022.1 hypothetical protein BSK54_12510 [Paenibacillus odorifer]
MVDMMYLSYRMTIFEYNIAFKTLQAYLKQNYPKNQLHTDQKDRNSYVTNALSKHGFQEIRLRKTVWGFCFMEIRFRPQLIINELGYYSLTNISEFKDISEKFNCVMKDFLSLNVPDFFEWNAKRIEAAVDIDISEDLIPKYLILFKRGYIPEYLFENKQTQLHWGSLTNVYLMSTNKTVNWYNRYETLLEKDGNSEKQYQDFSETKGILRFETQVRNGKELVVDVLSQDRLKKEVMKFYKLIVGKGDYHTLDKALQLISQNESDQYKREELTHMLKLLESCGGINSAKKIFLKGKDTKKAADKFGKLIKRLRNLNINPVIIPDEWGIVSLENLYHRIEKGLLY